MPGKQRFLCHWCRNVFGTYAEMTSHHSSCPEKPTNRGSIPPDLQKGAPVSDDRFHCPHEACDSNFGSFDSLQTHLNHCPKLREARDFADHIRFRDDIDGESAKALREADFEAWCRQHRPELLDEA